MKMKLLLYTSLLLFVYVSTCDDDGVSSYSDCKNKGSNCCFIIFDYDCQGVKKPPIQRCVDSSSVSSIVSNMEERVKDKKCGGTLKNTIQCSSNSSNYLIFDLLALIILFYITVY